MSAPPATISAAPKTSLFPTSSDPRRKTTESATPASDSIATSGATTVEFKKAVLALKVTPQITPDNRIILDLNVLKTRVDEFEHAELAR